MALPWVEGGVPVDHRDPLLVLVEPDALLGGLRLPDRSLEAPVLGVAVPEHDPLVVHVLAVLARVAGGLTAGLAGHGEEAGVAWGQGGADLHRLCRGRVGGDRRTGGKDGDAEGEQRGEDRTEGAHDQECHANRGLGCS